MRYVIPFLCLVALASCAPVETYYKPGVSIAKLADDELTCEVDALQQAPVEKVREQGSPIYVPPRRYCDGAGHCWTDGGYWEPGMIYTVDVNRDLRNRLEQRCMSQRGYTPVTIPRCDPGVSAPGPTTVLPPLTENSCAIAGSNGSFNVVTP